MIDVTHGIEPQAVLQGALVLATRCRTSPRASISRSSTRGRQRPPRGRRPRPRGPCLRRPGQRPARPRSGARRDRGRLGARERRLPAGAGVTDLSRPDVFAPAAAYVATGVMPEELGPALEPGVARPARAARGRDRRRRDPRDRAPRRPVRERAAEPLAPPTSSGPGIAPGAQLGLGSRRATARGTFADARSGRALLYEDSYGRMALAIAGGNAAETLSIRAGDELTITGN